MTATANSSELMKDLGRAALMGVGVLLLAFLGMATRSDIASFWPANAFVLGMMICFPTLARPLCWLGAAVGFFAADAITGSLLLNNVLLNGGNMLSIAVAYWRLSALAPEDKRLVRPLSVFRVVGAIAIAAIASGLLGMIADPLLFGGDVWYSFVFWSTTELVNYVAFLPMLLAMPLRTEVSSTMGSLDKLRFSDALPALTVIAACALGVALGGPGAIAIPLLAMLWCATRYGLFTVTTMSFLFIAWTLLAISFGWLEVADHRTDRSVLLSIRFGVAVLGLAPIVVSSVMQSQRRLANDLYRLSMEDSLTGLLNRRAFQVQGESLLADARRQETPVAMIMLDIDHFKVVNDTYGHAAGDQLLVELSAKLRRSIRAGDLAARWGGEEFVVLLRNCAAPNAERIAERIKTLFAEAGVDTEEHQDIRATLSAGLSTATQPESLDQLLSTADRALYVSKREGRNRTTTLSADADDLA